MNDTPLIVHNYPSFKDALLTSNGEKAYSQSDNESSEDSKDDKEFEMDCDLDAFDEEDFEYVSNIEGFPLITVSDRRQDALAKTWHNSIIV